MTQASMGPSVSLRFALPRAELRPFVTTYYHAEVRCSEREPVLEDYLHPEWANLRFFMAGECEGAIGDARLVATPRFLATGPTSRPTRFRFGTGRMWGIGLMPAGWAAFVRASAADYADRFADGSTDRVFAAFHPLARALAEGPGDFAEGLALIEAHMERIRASCEPAHGGASDPIRAISTALVDPDCATVAELAHRAGKTIRSLERLTPRAFGFAPKLLLRRQRFLRSLAQFMLDPSLKWLDALDGQYHDQAHFVRDFKRFMGMNPSYYARLDKPFLVAAARARMAAVGQAVQGLHPPQSIS